MTEPVVNHTNHFIAQEILEEQHIKTDMQSKFTYLYRNGYYDHVNSIPWLKQEIQKKLCANTTNSRVKEILEYIIRDTYQDFNSTNNYICLNNWLLNLDTMKTEKHNPNILVTQKIPVNYDHTIKSSLFNMTVQDLVEPKDVSVLQEGIGNILSNHYLTKKLLYLYGNNDSGKSTFLDIIGAFLSKRNFSAISLQGLGTRFINSHIFNKLANISADEPYKVTLKYYGLVKNFTGGDEVMLEFKGKDAFQCKSSAKLFFSGNGIPSVAHTETDDAFFRRWQFVKFPNHFEPDDNIFKLNTTDAMKSSILNWMIEGYQRLKQNGWKFTNDTSIEETRKMFESAIYERTLLDQWITENCVSYDGYELKPILYRHYRQWCVNKKRNDFEGYEAFCKSMGKQMFIPVSDYLPTINNKQQSALKGIKLKTPLNQFFNKGIDNK